jgi:hypothetical protein
MELTDIERQALGAFLAVPSPVRTAITKFAQEAKQRCERAAADSLRSLPRQLELACDAAAKAEAYGTLIEELTRFASK